MVLVLLPSLKRLENNPMAEFNPAQQDFDYEVDPITADKHGMMILDQLRQGRKWFADYDRVMAERGGEVTPVDPATQQQPDLIQRMRQAQEKLTDNLRKYRNYKDLRGERMFSRVEAVKAREKALVGEEFARKTVAWLQADDETFDSLLNEQGDYESYKAKEAWMVDKSVLRDDYLKKRVLRNWGYSDTEIDSGAAEAEFRKHIQAGDDEPTVNAASEWSLSEINKYDRRKEMVKWAGKTTTDLFLGMNGEAVKSFEKRLSEEYPNISDEERTQLRANMNAQRQKMEEMFKDIRPLVRKTFNTIAEAEGIKSQFDAPEDAPFANMQEATKELTKLPKEDFGNFLAMLAKTAEAHGQNLNDTDKIFNNVVKSFSRGGGNLVRGVSETLGAAPFSRYVETAEATAQGKPYQGVPHYIVEAFDKEGNSLGFDVVPQDRPTKIGMDSWVDIIIGGRVNMTPEEAEKYLAGRRVNAPDTNRPFFGGEDPAKVGASYKVLTSKEEMERGLKGIKSELDTFAYASEARNWRDQVARIESQNWFMNDWVYGIPRSLPEMAATMTGIAGIAMVTMAQKERNMAEIRRRFPEDDWAKYDTAATFAATQYALLNKAQLTIAGGAIKRLPKVGSLVEKLGTAGVLAGTIVAEAGIEAVQDLTLSGTLELYDALSDDIESFELTKDIKKQIKKFPRTMFAVAPLAVAGVIGQKAIERFGRPSIEKVLSDEALLEAYGVDEAGRAKMRQMGLEEKIDYLVENEASFAENRVEIPAFDPAEMEFSAEIVANDNGTFTISDGTTVLEAKTPEEAAEAMAQLDPDYVQKAEQIVFGSTEPAFADPGVVSFGDDTIELQTADGPVIGPANFSLSAFHGTPWNVDRFSTEFIGTGEGRQAFGWGLYFAQDIEVAKGYAEKLSRKIINPPEILRKYFKKGEIRKTRFGYDRILNFEYKGPGDWYVEVEEVKQNPQTGGWETVEQLPRRHATEPDAKDLRAAGIEPFSGNLYTVRLNIEKDQFLEWDKPLSEKISKVFEQEFERIGEWSSDARDHAARTKDKGWVNAKSAYSALQGIVGGQNASMALAKAGIKGIRFFDGNSRKKNEGSYNYVVFDGNDIEIVSENGTTQLITEISSADYPYTPGGTQSPDIEFVDDTPRPTAQPAAEPVSSIEFNAQFNQQTPRTGMVSDPQINRSFGDLKDQTLRLFAPGFGSAFQSESVRARMEEGLPPIPREETEGEIPTREAVEFKIRSLLAQRDVPSRTLQRILDEGTRKAKGVESQFADIAKAMADRVRRYTKKQPVALREARREQVMSDAYYALRGSQKAMQALPTSIRKIVEQARKSIDIYSQKLIDSGQIEGNLAEAVGNNIGAYVTREFKIFNPAYKWNYYIIKSQYSDIYEAAMEEIMSTEVDGVNLTAKEADQIIRDITDSSRAAKGFYSGRDTVGKVDVTSFIRRKDLSPAMLDLLGEVVDPMVNIANTGRKVSRASIVFETQRHMAEHLLAAGLAFRKPVGRFIKRIGEETYEYEGVDANGDPKKMKGRRVNKSMKGFDGLYMEPELATELELYFKPADGKRKSPFEILGNALAAVTGVGKFNQVILNPAAYPTNFLGGVATEILNGRVSFDAKGARAYFKGGAFRNFGKDPNAPYDVQDQAAFYDSTGADFLKNGGVNSIGRNQLNTEMQQKGLLDNSVFAEDFNQTIDKIGLGAKAAKVSRVLSSIYQASDNAIKRAAFAHELDKWARAEPTKKMDELVDLAAADVRATTQNYDMVPRILKAFSQRGTIAPTYVSFAYELHRTTIGTVRLAAREIFSGNPVLRNAGLKRVAGMGVTGALLYGLTSGISQILADLTDEEREKLRAQLPPWLEDMEVAYLKADGEELVYFDPSYIIPHQIYYNAVMRAVRAETVEEKFEQTASNILGSFFQGNILQQTASEAIANQKIGGGDVYNEEIVKDQYFGKERAIAEHFFDSMFTPGIWRTYKKIQKAEEGEIGFKGSTASMDDIWLGLLGIRPYRYDIQSAEFIEGSLSKFSYDVREIKSWVSEKQQERRGKGEGADPDTSLTPSQKKAKEDVERSMARKVREFRTVITMLQKVGIENRRIKKALRDTRTPKELRDEAKDLLTEN